MKYSPKLPLSKGFDDTHIMNDNILDVVKQNMKMLILTNPGERMWMPDFGVGIYSFFFENISPPVLQLAESAIRDQVRTFMPFVKIKNIYMNTSDTDPNIPLNRVNISIEYFIPSLNFVDVLQLETPNLSSQIWIFQKDIVMTTLFIENKGDSSCATR